MSTIINGTSSAITFPDSSVQNTSAIVSGYVPYANLPAGSVLQVVNLSTVGYSTNATNTFTNVPNLSLAITPKFATSKILVMLTLVGVGHYNATTYCNLRLLRNGSEISWYENAGGWTSTSTENNVSSAYNYVDSPATTSATTYSVQFSSGNNVTAASVGNYVASSSNAKHSIILMEIAA